MDFKMSNKSNLKPKNSFHHATNSNQKILHIQPKEQEIAATSALMFQTPRLKNNHRMRLESPNKHRPSEQLDESGSFQPPIDSIKKGKRINNKVTADLAAAKNPSIKTRRKKSLPASNEQDDSKQSLEKRGTHEQKILNGSVSLSNKTVNLNPNIKIVKKQKSHLSTQVTSNNEVKGENKENSTNPKDTSVSSSPQNLQNGETLSESSKLNFDLSSKLVLHSNILSPQARSCLMLMKFLDLDLEVKEVEQLTCEHLSEDFQKINAWHMIPKLEHKDMVLTDSHTIMMYLCVTFPSEAAQQLFPECPLARLKIMNMLFFEAQILFRRYSNYMTDIVRKEHSNIDFDVHKQKIFEVYEMLNGFLKNSRYLVGDEFTLADISMVATFSALDLMMPLDTYKDYWPYLSTWFQRIREMPMYEPNCSGVMKQREIIRSFDKSLIPISVCQNEPCKK